jgi:hypothetical protein
MAPRFLLRGVAFWCSFGPPGRFPFHQVGHPLAPRYLWPLEQVFLRFALGIVLPRSYLILSRVQLMVGAGLLFNFFLPESNGS